MEHEMSSHFVSDSHKAMFNCAQKIVQLLSKYLTKEKNDSATFKNE